MRAGVFSQVGSSQNSVKNRQVTVNKGLVNEDSAWLVALPEPVQKQLLDRFVVGHHDVADGVSADKVADFLGEVFGMVAGTLQRLGHEDDLQAGTDGAHFQDFQYAA